MMIVGLASNSYFGGRDYLLQGCKGIFTEGERITFQFFELRFDNEEPILWKPKQGKISWQRDLTQIVKYECQEWDGGNLMEAKDTMSWSLAMYNYEAKRYTFIGNFFKNTKGKFLDVGCCRGGLRKYLHGGLEYYGADALINNFENYIRVDLNSKILPFKSKQFDAVNCSDVLEHLFYPLEILKEIKRVLKDNGSVLVSLPNDKGLNRIFVDLFSNIQSYEDAIFEHHWRFSIRTARELFQKEFKITEESPEFGPVFRKYLFFLKFRRFCSGWFMFGMKK